MKKLFRILSVVAALTMLISTLMVTAPASPVLADDDDWSMFDLPTAGAGGDWFMDLSIVGFTAFAQASDDTLYLYMDNTAVADDNLYKSTDGGRSWDATDFAADVTAGYVAVDIACSPEDPDILYVAASNKAVAGDDEIWKSDDGGDSWTGVDNASLAGLLVATDYLTAVDVGYVAGKAYVYVGWMDSAAAFAGGVAYNEDFTFGALWTDLTVDALADATVDVYALNVSPDFENDTNVYAVATDAAPKTYIVRNNGAAVGTWTDVAQLQAAAAAAQVSFASDIKFVDDFADEGEMFVGATVVGATVGDVWRVDDGSPGTSYELGVDAEIVSLDVVGAYGETSQIAGAAGAGPVNVYYSTDDGDSWDDSIKDPFALGAATANLVALSADFASTGEAWCAASDFAAGTEASVSRTVDFGDTWNGVSMLDTEMDGSVWDFTFTADGGMMFVASVSSTAASAGDVWSYDGDVWERIYANAANATDLVELSPGFDSDMTMFIADSAAPTILRSDDGGASFTALANQPAAGVINAWIVIDDVTLLVADAAANIEKTDRYGRRVWDDVSPTGNGNITDFAMSPNFASDGMLLAGDATSEVYISTDEGDTWDEVSATDLVAFGAGGAQPTYVAFDPNFASNNMFYAASDTVAASCEWDDAEDAGDQAFSEFDTTTPGPITAADGIVVSKDSASTSTIYILDSGAGAGMFRALDPWQDADDVVFENVIGAAAAITLAPMVATITTVELTSGSAEIWGIDQATTIDIWSYTDNLSGAVSLTAPANNANIDETDRTTFEWADLADAATNYDLYLATDEDFADFVTITVAYNPRAVADVTEHRTAAGGLDAGTKYYWKVQVNGPVLSRESAVRTFTTKVGAPAAPVQVVPEPGASDVIAKPTFGWLAIGGASVYKIVVATDPAFANVVASGESTINAWALPEDVTLEYSTTYYWKVWGEAANGAPAGDEIISAFTTMAEPAPPVTTPPVVVTVPPQPPAPTITLTVPEAATPGYVWAIIGIGAVLVIALIVLIARTRRVV